MMDQRIASFGRRDAASSTFKQHHFAERFHITQPLTGRRQRKANIGGTMGDTAGIYHSEKQAKISQVKAHKARLSHN